MGVEWQEILKCLLLAPIEHVALVLGDDKRQASDLGRKISQLDATEVRQRNFRAPVGFLTTVVDVRLNGPHFLVGDDQEIARAAGRIEDADLRHALTQVEQHACIVAGLIQSPPQVIEEQRVQHLQDVWHAGVMHAERAAFVLIRHGLDH
ncbi:hypothetical protein ASF28_10010 [Methylobacterium sp. Leaf99]|nr:hypothetical protein ASF28_10010 [Methylobacterium sp. Leaf99]